MSTDGNAKAPDFEPPMACVNRILKAALPDSIAVTKDARTAFARAAGIFVFYLTHAANEISRESKRQTILTSDVIKALKELGYDEFEAPLEQFLEVYRKDLEDAKKNRKSSDGSKGADKEGDMETSLNQGEGEEMEEAD